MTVHIRRPYLLGLALVALCGVVVGWWSTTVAQAQEVPLRSQVVCVQVAQVPGRTDEAFLANFMSEQIAAGRSRFETVTGISTVLCAW